MPHYVQRKGYWSLEESYRDANGKPRKRYLKYLGKLGVPVISLSASLRSEPGIAAADRAMERADKERGPVVEEVSKIPSGLHVGPVDPTPVETSSPPAEDTSPQAADPSESTSSEAGDTEGTSLDPAE